MNISSKTDLNGLCEGEEPNLASASVSLFLISAWEALRLRPDLNPQNPLGQC